MGKQDRTGMQMPAELVERYIAVAAELESMHGAPFAAAFLSDIGVVPVDRVAGIMRNQDDIWPSTPARYVPSDSHRSRCARG